MQQLLTGRTRLPGFTAPWSSTTLGGLGTFLKGRGIRRDDVRGSGIRCIRYGELYTSFHDYTGQTRSFVSPEVAATALPLRTGDVLFAGSGETRDEIGKCVAYVGPTPAVAGGDVIVFRGEGLNPVFLALLANSPEVAAQKARAGQGDAVVHIYGHALAAIEVSVPPREEQDAIAEAITDSESEIGVLRRRLVKARSIKIGMMQELLTGTRLPVEEAVA
jgi:type I restriction enzyme, S subunit